MARFALVVEDNPDVAALYRHVVESLGFETEVLRSGEAASARLEMIVPAVVVLDIHLPVHVSGTDILRQIRADKRLTRTRVIVVTGHVELAETIRDDADAVLIKPIDVSQLSSLITQLLPRDRTD